MAKVSDLTLAVQKGTDNVLVATWEFKESKKKSTSSTSSSSSSKSFKKGDHVKITGTKYYNGVKIPDWVRAKTWIVYQVNGSRVVINKSTDGKSSIMSPVKASSLSKVSSSKSASRAIARASATEVKYLDHYEAKWYYATGNGVWFDGGSQNDLKLKNCTYSIPENATKVKVSVKPVAKTHKVGKKKTETPYYSSTWVSKEYVTSQLPPEKPSTPSVEIEKLKLTAKLDNISDPRSDQIEFQIYNGTKKVQTTKVNVSACMATYSYTVTAGGKYRVRCRAINLVGKTLVYSDWSDFSSEAETIPLGPDEITDLRAISSTEIYVEWTKVDNCESYEVQYATKKSYFDSSSETKSTTVESVVNHCELTGVENGHEYFVRVRAVNDKGNSSWSPIKSIVLGKKPAAPTTWSSTTTVIVGETLTLYWIHNAQDGSSQTYAELEMTINGETTTKTIKNSTDEDEKDKTSHFEIDTTQYTEGVSIQWRVRTAGVTKEYGDWSVMRTVDIYARPTLEMTMTDKDATSINVLSTFPFYISALAGPQTQRPIGYHLSVVADEMYETVDGIGNDKWVNVGEEVYSKYFDVNEPLIVEFSPSNIDLENNISYTVKCIVSMNSGLTAEATLQFTVDWVEMTYEPDCEIVIEEDLSATIIPYCFYNDGDEPPVEEDTPVDEDTTDEDEGVPVNGVLLSVYRREFDGTFTEIGTDIDQTLEESVTDPHPSLDYARYRIVATSQTTGAVSYYDPPGYPVECTDIIIQWDEEWTDFNMEEDVTDDIATPTGAGSMLRLPYNIDTSEKTSPDVALVEYIGRKHAVSYYGTQLGTTATWNLDIVKSDKDTLYALRRLQVWMGDVYVREPSGVGYWANINVSFSQKHCELTIPVTLDITRVEGGK